ncbi:MAG: type I methionyl aminopeptidase [Candidatus Desulfofervidus auxilii]|nr:type I methionyl aminopeptidase [Candidatus Desulfofervidus auxilii]
MIILKAPWEIEKMRRSNAIVAEILAILKEAVKPGITTMELNELAEELCIKKGARPAFKGYRNYPYSLCVSINEEVVHGLPSKKRYLQEGDIVSLDFGVFYDGYYGDAAITVPVGKISANAKRLLEVTENALYKGIEQAREGRRVLDISAAIQTYVESHGYSVVRQFVGHGIGRSLHEDPQVPNFGKPGKGAKLKVGMVLAIEPMVNEGTYEVEILPDGWTAVTKDRKLSAHFEHTVAITKNGPEILSKI